MNKHYGRESQWARFTTSMNLDEVLVHMYSNILLFPGFLKLFF